jgi:hypothetical protein
MSIFNRRSNDSAPSVPHNSGVVQSGSGSMGNVQNQPGAVGSSQRQVNVAAAKEAVEQWPQLMQDLEQAFADDRDRVTDPDTCRMMLGLLRNQDVSQEEGRQRAHSFLGVLSESCGGAPGISTLIASALSVLSVAMG